MLKANSKIIGFFVIAFLVLLLILKRGGNFLSGDFFYFIDQSRDMSLVGEIIWNKDIPLIGARSGVQGIFHGPLWLFYLVPFFIFSSGNPFFTFIPALLLVEIATLFSIVFVFSKFFGKWTGYLCGLFFVISTEFTNSFNFGSNAQVSSLIFIWFVFFFLRFINNTKSTQAFVFMSVMTGLMFHFEYAFTPVLLLIQSVLLILNYKKIGFRSLSISVALVLIILSNFIIFNFRHDNLIYRSAANYLLDNKKTLSGYKEHKDINYRLSDRLKIATNLYTTPFVDSINVNLQPGTMRWIYIIAFLLLTIFSLHTNRSDVTKKVTVLLMLPIIYFFLTLFYPNPIWIHYFLPLYLLSFLLVAWILNWILTQKILLPKMLVLLYIFLIIVNVVVNLRFTSASGGYKDHLRVTEKVFSLSENEDIVRYFVYDTGKLTYGFDYMMKWYSYKVGKNIVKDKKGNYFVLSYPPPSWNKDEYQYWLKNILKNDRSSKLLQSQFGNILLQKYKPAANELEPIYSEINIGNFYR